MVYTNTKVLNKYYLVGTGTDIPEHTCGHRTKLESSAHELNTSRD